MKFVCDDENMVYFFAGNSRKVLMILTVDIGDSLNRAGDIVIREGDSATDLAWSFCDEFGLNKEDVVGPLAEHIQNNMDDVKFHSHLDERSEHSDAETLESAKGGEALYLHSSTKRQLQEEYSERRRSPIQANQKGSTKPRTHAKWNSRGGRAEHQEDMQSMAAAQLDR
jgi:hypothetical protein